MSSRKNRSPEEQARRAKIQELLQESNIGSMEDIAVSAIFSRMLYLEMRLSSKRKSSIPIYWIPFSSFHGLM